GAMWGRVIQSSGPRHGFAAKRASWNRLPPRLVREHPLPDRASSSEHFEAQQRLVTPIPFDVVTRGEKETRFDFRHSSRSPLIQQLTHEPQRVDLVIVLARRKGEQLCFQVRQPWRAGGHVQTVQLHAATDALRTHRFVVARGKLLAFCIGLPLPAAEFYWIASS